MINSNRNIWSLLQLLFSTFIREDNMFVLIIDASTVHMNYKLNMFRALLKLAKWNQVRRDFVSSMGMKQMKERKTW